MSDRFKNYRLYALIAMSGRSILAFLKGCVPIFIFYAIMLVVVFLLNLIFGEGTIPIPAMEAIGSLIAVPYLRYVFRKDVLIRAYGIKQKTANDPKRKLFRYVYAMVTIAAISFALNNLFGAVSLDRFSTRYESASNALYSGPVWVQLICLGAVIPYAEELLFRGVILGRLRDAFGGKKAIIISAVLFALAHGNLVQILFAFVVGLALGYFADKNQSFIPSLLGHIVSNLLAIGARYEVIPLPHNVFFHIILAIVFGALASTLFGLQFKLKRLK